MGQALQLKFSHLTEEKMDLIRLHYLDRKGTFDFFIASPALWGDYSTDPPVPLLGNTVWRFADAPVIQDVSFDRFDVSVNLVSHAVLQGDLLSIGVQAPDSGATDADYIYDGGQASTTHAYNVDAGAS